MEGAFDIVGCPFFLYDLMKKHNFRELVIWQDTMSFVKKVYGLSMQLPAEERFGLISQVNRSSISIPSNIAEGSGRSSSKEFVRFLEIALSSAYELETQLILINELYNLDTKEHLTELSSLQKKIGAFIRKVKSMQMIENK